MIGTTGEVTGVLCALPRELGTLVDHVLETRIRQGLEILEIALPRSGGAGVGDPHPVLACVGGVGKVAAARAATLLLEEGAHRLLVVGACGALRRGMAVGSLLHAHHTIQSDLAVREGRECEADPRILSAWQEAAPGLTGWLITADRPVVTPWRRLRLARAHLGPCAADMETAAAAAVATLAGVPWGALRVVTDQAGPSTPVSFARNYPIFAGRPADTVADLLRAL